MCFCLIQNSWTGSAWWRMSPGYHVKTPQYKQLREISCWIFTNCVRCGRSVEVRISVGLDAPSSRPVSTNASVCVERRRGTSVTHQRAPVCKLRGRPTVGRSITTVDRTLISRGISSYSRSRTNKLSPNIGFAWQWGSLWVCVWGGGGGGGGWGHAYIKQRRSVNIGVWRINTLFFLKERLMLKHHSASLPGPSVSRGPDRHFSFVALAGKDGAQIKISLSEVKYLCIQNKAVCNFQTGGERGNESARGGGGRRRNMHLHQRRGRQNTFRKLAFLK